MNWWILNMQCFPEVSCLLCDLCLLNWPSAQSHAALAFKHVDARGLLLLERCVRLKNVNKFRGSVQKVDLTYLTFWDFFKRISSVKKKVFRNRWYSDDTCQIWLTVITVFINDCQLQEKKNKKKTKSRVHSNHWLFLVPSLLFCSVK